MESSGITFLVGPRHLTSVGSPPEFRQLFGTFPGNQHLNTMKVLVKWDDLIEHHFTFKWSGNISQQRPLQQLPRHLGKIPKNTFPRKLEDVGLVVCGKIPCLYGITTVSGGGLGGSGQSGPQFLKTQNLWRSLVVLPPGCRFKYSLQAQHQHLGVFRWPKQNVGLVMSEALMKLERAPKITMTQKTCLSMSTLLNSTPFCNFQVLSFGDIQCLVWGICQKAVISRGFQLPTSTGSWSIKSTILVDDHPLVNKPRFIAGKKWLAVSELLN